MIRYNNKMIPALFLDRDGVIIENVASYVRSWDDVLIYQQALDALALIKDTPYKIMVVTNQSAIGRNIISQEAAEEINQRLISEIQIHGGRIDQIYMCPHAPQDLCSCRKPNPGLINDAAMDHSIDLKKSVLIGDAFSDLNAGFAAGIPTNILVRTGRGNDQIKNHIGYPDQPYRIYDTLKDAILSELLLRNNPSSESP